MKVIDKIEVDCNFYLRDIENVLRTNIQFILKDKYGDSWEKHLGVSKDRIKKWEERKEEERNRLNGKVIYEGDLELNFIFTDNSVVGVNSKKVTVPFEQTVEGVAENCKMDTNIEVNSQEFLNQAGAVSANLDLNFETATYRTTAIPVINDITTIPQEELEDYSVIIYVVKPGDTLWKIAKRFGSTVDDIVRVNGIERPDKLNTAEKIYIPKYVLKRAREPITLSTNV